MSKVHQLACILSVISIILHFLHAHSYASITLRILTYLPETIFQTKAKLNPLSSYHHHLEGGRFCGILCPQLTAATLNVSELPACFEPDSFLAIRVAIRGSRELQRTIRQQPRYFLENCPV